MMLTLLLAGYYGQQNLGDDLLLKIVLDRVTKCSSIQEISVTCDNPGGGYICQWMPDLKLVNTAQGGGDIFSRYDRVLFGGGGTIFDYREFLPLRHVVRKQLSVLRTYGWARFRGTRFASIGIGIGPFGGRRAMRAATARLRYQDLVFVRDAASVAYATKATSSPVLLAPDLSLAEYSATALAAKQARPVNRTTIIVRHYRYGAHGDKYLPELMRLAEHFSASGHEVMWASFQPRYDDPVIRILRNKDMNVWEWDPRTMTFLDAYEMIAASECVLTARMHGIYLAGMLGVPVVGIGLHPKLSYAASLFPDYATVVEASPSYRELLDAYARVTGMPPRIPHDSLQCMEQDIDAAFKQILQWLQ